MLVVDEAQPSLGDVLLVHSRDVRGDLIDALHAHADGRDHQAGAG
jgi:hypothetical protein